MSPEETTRELDAIFGKEKPRPKPAFPKPKVPVVEPVVAPTPEPIGVDISKREKPKFVRKPHLTERPFQSHEGLQALQKQMESQKPKRRGQRRTNKEKK